MECKRRECRECLQRERGERKRSEAEKIKKKKNLSIKFIFVASIQRGEREEDGNTEIDRVTKRREEGAPNTGEDHGARTVNTNLSTRKKEKERDAKSLQGAEGASIDES